MRHALPIWGRSGHATLLPDLRCCCYHYNMKAALLQKSRVKLGDNRFADIVIWQVPVSVPGSLHSFKYRLALVVDGVCAMRYDNESGKGDHKHLGE